MIFSFYHLFILQISLLLFTIILLFIFNPAKGKRIHGKFSILILAYVEKFIKFIILLTWNLSSCLYLDSLIRLPIFTTILLLYSPTFLDGSERSGSRTPILKSASIWNIIRSHFSIKIVKTCELTEKNYIFVTHPHAVLPFASTIAFGQTKCENSFHSLYPNLEVRFLAASFCFNVPIYRDLLIYSGVLEADYQTGIDLLKDGYSITVYPGGAEEALFSRPEKDIIILKKRRGFIKLAMKNGTSIVPCFCFNESNGWEQSKRNIYFWDLFRSNFKNLTGISIPNVSNIFPKKNPCTLVIGNPIKISKGDQEEEIEKYLKIYIESIVNLHQEYSKTYSIPKDKYLEVL